MAQTLDNFFEKGFRPFFLGAALWAACGMFLWTLMFRGALDLEFQWSARDWHIHEMLFGYVSAVIAGFLLTAVPNWTGLAAPKGVALAGLFGLWIAGRLAILFSNCLPPLLVAAIDISFLVVLEIWLIRVLVRSGNNRNLVVAGLIALFIISNAAIHSGAWKDIGVGGGLLATVMLISLIGGRVIPAFTRNWLAQQGAPNVIPNFGVPDGLALASSALAICLFAFGIEGGLTGAAFLLASLASLVRLKRWQGLATAKEPLVLIMHLAYLWLPVGYALLAISQVSSIVTVNSGLHALTSGAVGTVTLAIMTRASLGHSGKPLQADRATLAVYFLVTLAAGLRVASDVFPDPVLAKSLAGLAWSAAFLTFALAYGRLFLRSQSD